MRSILASYGREKPHFAKANSDRRLLLELFESLNQKPIIADGVLKNLSETDSCKYKVSSSILATKKRTIY